MTRHLPAETSQNLRLVTITPTNPSAGVLNVAYVVTDDLGNPLPNEPVEMVVDALDSSVVPSVIGVSPGTKLGVLSIQASAHAPSTPSTTVRGITNATGLCTMNIASVPPASYNITSQVGSRRIYTPFTTTI